MIIYVNQTDAATGHTNSNKVINYTLRPYIDRSDLCDIMSGQLPAIDRVCSEDLSP